MIISTTSPVLRWKCNCSCVLSGLKNKSSKFIKSLFFMDTVYTYTHWLIQEQGV